MELKDNRIIKLDMYQVDAFTKEMFKGNPAMVCYSETDIDEPTMQNIALEANLSETAFIVPVKNNEYEIRWFTPKTEMNLCGHATLAASKVLFDMKSVEGNEIIYHSKSGILKALNVEEGISLNFPMDTVINENESKYEGLLSAMGVTDYVEIIKGERTKKLVVCLKSKEEVLKLKPNFEKMLDSNVEDIKGVGITSKDDDNEYDFVTRYFNPWAGVNEDPVTGSVHTVLAKYWGEIFEKEELKAYQLSKRGGTMILRIVGDNTLEMIGEACIVFDGKLHLRNRE